MAKKREPTAETSPEPDVAGEKPAQGEAAPAEPTEPQAPADKPTQGETAAERPTKYDVVTENPAAPASPEQPIITTAPWHNTPGTGAYTEPEVTTVHAYEQSEDGPVIAKVLEAPARPRATRGPRASTDEQQSAEETEAGEDVDGEAD